MVGVRFIRWPHNESNFVKTESVIGVGQLVSRKAISLSAARNKRVGLQRTGTAVGMLYFQCSIWMIVFFVCLSDSNSLIVFSSGFPPF